MALVCGLVFGVAYLIIVKVLFARHVRAFGLRQMGRLFLQEMQQTS